MSRSLRVTCWRSFRRRLCAGITLLAYVLATFGVPLPATARNPAAIPFPCQDHSCGCRTAEQCWASCCCFTPEQRWAWARARQIKPPACAEEPSARGWRTGRLRDRVQAPAKAETVCSQCVPQKPAKAEVPAAKKSCCPEEPGRPSCGQTPAPAGETKPPRPGCHPAPGRPSCATKPAGKGSVRWGLGLASQRCQGLNTLWATTGAALPSEQPLRWNPYLTAVGWLTAAADSPLALPSAPLEPPPRA